MGAKIVVGLCTKQPRCGGTARNKQMYNILVFGCALRAVMLAESLRGEKKKRKKLEYTKEVA